MTGTDPRGQAVVKVLTEEGGAPGSSLHSWRCNYPDQYGPCTCLAVTAALILAALDASPAPGQDTDR